jgi:Ni/Co efflux regulator RcnB
MFAKGIAKRIVPMVLAGAAMLVFAMPLTASAHDGGHDHWRHREWEHHDEGRHLGWYHHHDRDDDDCDFRPGRRAYYPSNGYYYGGQPAYPAFQGPLGYGYGGNGRMNNLQQQWANTQARHQQALANGNRRAAKLTSKRLWTLDQNMGRARGYAPNGNGYYNQPYANGSFNGPYPGANYNNPYTNGYHNNGYAGSQLGQLGSMFGVW